MLLIAAGRPRGLPDDPAGVAASRLLAAAALLLVGGALAAGSGLLRPPTVVPPVPDPSVIAIATASPDVTSPSPIVSAAPTPVPSATPAPITWTEASLKEDWPAPVRTEPAGGASVEPLLLRLTGDRDECGRKADPVGDTGSDAYPWVDIRGFVFCGHTLVGFTLDSNQPPVVHPTEQWIAYGVVTDDDGDGVADRRIGMDNIPHVADRDLDYRAWATDLHTGRTIVGWDNPDGCSDCWYPPGSGRLPGTDVDFRFGGASLAGGGSAPGPSPNASTSGPR